MNNNVPKKLCQQQTCSAVVVNLSTRCFSAVMHRNCFSVLLIWLTAHFYLKLSSSQHSAIKLCQQTKVIRYWVVNLSANNGQGVAITLQAQFSADVCGALYINLSSSADWLPSNVSLSICQLMGQKLSRVRKTQELAKIQKSAATAQNSNTNRWVPLKIHFNSAPHLIHLPTYFLVWHVYWYVI